MLSYIVRNFHQQYISSDGFHQSITVFNSSAQLDNKNFSELKHVEIFPYVWLIGDECKVKGEL